MADLWCTVTWTYGSPTSDRAELPQARAERPRIHADLPPLYVLSTMADGLRRVAASGELDLATMPLLDASIAEAFAAPRRTPGRFLLDLAGVSFLDVSALSALDRVEVFARHSGAELSVVAPVAPGPRRLLLFAVGREWLSTAFTPLPVRRTNHLVRPA